MSCEASLQPGYNIESVINTGLQPSKIFSTKDKGLARLTHQSPALRAEVIRHSVSSGDCLVLREFGQQVLTPNMLQSGVVDDEVGGEHS